MYRKKRRQVYNKNEEIRKIILILFKYFNELIFTGLYF